MVSLTKVAIVLVIVIVSLFLYFSDSVDKTGLEATVENKVILITNRDVVQEAFEFVFSEYPNTKGPNELSSFTVTGSPSNPTVSSIDEHLDRHLAGMGSEKLNALFYIHGFNTSAREAISDALSMSRLYSRDVLLFSWSAPEYNWIELISHRDAIRDARASRGALGRLLSKLKENRTPKVEWDLMAFSLGNSFLVESVLVEPKNLRQFRSVISVAAAVNSPSAQGWFSELAKQTSTHILYNKNDYALYLQKIVMSEPRMGAQPFFRTCFDNVNYTEVTEIQSVGLSHSYHVNQKSGTEVKNLILSILKDNPPPNGCD